ncbi:MAG TPA: serine/threonine protein kinase [Leptolyngbyaceae cyanobacterium M33_DOE_097]|uniref:Serine/threonine protein kinase n=1 Tax=Oscillatoriales cyanobacterium SpSt-418 TaxID=2282169 RepID=A0A7C3KGU7_9CYAN|nr:serine/threonine protein kinase [Leptolyngbyaceae cyanobacterium M33_DOE_097]
MDEWIHTVLGNRYQIQSLLGRQTGRRTFLAIDSETQTQVVVKLLLFGPDFTWEDLKLFEREAETLKSLEHPAIPHYLDFFEAETQVGKGFALVQSYLEARSLQAWVTGGRSFSEAELKNIANQLLEILDYLHSRQPPVIHRDIKPSNILLGDRTGNSPGTIYLVDFGSVQTAAHGGTMTIVGTYGYMPHEQFGGRALPASDLYSVGATLIYLATGQHPADLPQHNLRIEFEPFVSLSTSFTDWIRGLIAPNIAQRPDSARAALKALTRPSMAIAPTSSSSDRFVLGSHPSFSDIQLRKNSTDLTLVVPHNQMTILFSKASLSLSEITRFGGCLGFISILGFAFVTGILSFLIGFLMLFILGFSIIQAMITIFSGLTEQRKDYRVIFQRGPDSTIYATCILDELVPGAYSNMPLTLYSSQDSSTSPIVGKVNHIHLDKCEVSSDQDDPLSVHTKHHLLNQATNRSDSHRFIFQKKITSLDAGPCGVPRYQLELNSGLQGSFRITGTRQEIQWLCDELSEWSGLRVQYEDFTPSA